jgi:VWFA-related protein
MTVTAALASHASAAGRQHQDGPSARAGRASDVGRDAQVSTTPTPHTRPRTVAADPVGEEVGEDEVVRVNAHLVIIPASVVDGRGRAINDLQIEDFELRVDGQVRPIGDLSRTETPVHIALLFDNSASLSAARDFEKRAAIRFFRNVVRPIDRAAIFSVSTTTALEQPLTSDVQRLVHTIERFGKPEGATALFDAVAQAGDYLRPLAGRKVIVIVSDGADTISDVSIDEALRRTLQADCQIYVVQTRQIENPNLNDTASGLDLEKLAGQTGGAVYVPRGIEDLDAAFTQISLDLAQQYLLSYYPNDERKDRFFRFISLRVRARPDLHVRARRGFYPDPAQSWPATPSNATAGHAPSGSATGVGKKPAEATAAVAGVKGNKRIVAPVRAVPGETGKRLDFSRRMGPAALDEEEQSVGREAAPGVRTGPRSTVTDQPPVRAPAVASSVNAKVTSDARGDARPTAGRWFVICGSFAKSEHERAKELLARLRAKGYHADIIDTGQYPNLRKNLSAVVLGPYAKAHAENLRRKTLQEVDGGCYVKPGW